MTFRQRLSVAYDYALRALALVQELTEETFRKYDFPMLRSVRQRFQQIPAVANIAIPRIPRPRVRPAAEPVPVRPTNSMDCSCAGFHPAHSLDKMNVMRKMRRMERTIAWLQDEMHDMERFAVSGNFQPVLTETARSAENAKRLCDNLSTAMIGVIRAFLRDINPPNIPAQVPQGPA